MIVKIDLNYNHFGDIFIAKITREGVVMKINSHVVSVVVVCIIFILFILYKFFA